VYDYDAPEIERYVEATRTPDSVRAYLEEYVYGVKDHEGYLEKVGGQPHLSTLLADPVLGY
jgi:glutaconate CoA-transferase subunit A